MSWHRVSAVRITFKEVRTISFFSLSCYAIGSAADVCVIMCRQLARQAEEGISIDTA